MPGGKDHTRERESSISPVVLLAHGFPFVLTLKMVQLLFKPRHSVFTHRFTMSGLKRCWREYACETGESLSGCCRRRTRQVARGDEVVRYHVATLLEFNATIHVMLLVDRAVSLLDFVGACQGDWIPFVNG